jgi:hypothetical protein
MVDFSYNDNGDQLVDKLNILSSLIPSGEVFTDTTLTGNGTPISPLHVVSSGGGGGGVNCINLDVGTSSVNSSTVIPSGAFLVSANLIVNDIYPASAVSSISFTYANRNYVLDSSGNLFSSYSYGAFSHINSIPNTIRIFGSSSSLYSLDNSGGIHHSLNSGVSFSSLGSITNAIDISVNTTGGYDHIYVLDNTGKIWLSQYNGSAFSTFSNIATISNAKIISSATNPSPMGGVDQLFVIDSSGNVHCSSNAGSTFIIEGSVSNAISVCSYANWSGNGYNLFVLDNSGGIHYSSDNGASFSLLQTISNLEEIELNSNNGYPTTIDNAGNIYQGYTSPSSFSFMGSAGIAPTMDIQINSSPAFIMSGSGGHGGGSLALGTTGGSIIYNTPTVLEGAGTLGVILNGSPTAGSSTVLLEYISTFQN